jgi:hypothetical protein
VLTVAPLRADRVNGLLLLVPKQRLPSLDALFGRMLVGEQCVCGFGGAGEALEFRPALVCLHGCGKYLVVDSDGDGEGSSVLKF